MRLSVHLRGGIGLFLRLVPHHAKQLRSEPVGDQNLAAKANGNIVQIPGEGDQPLFEHISLQSGLARKIFPAAAPRAHFIAHADIHQRILNIGKHPVCLRHPDPQIIILFAKPILIPAGLFNERLFEHDRDLIHRASFFHVCFDIGILCRNRTLSDHMGRVSDKFRDLSADNVYALVLLKHGKLRCKAVRKRYIVRIHQRDQLICAMAQ